MLSYLLEDVPDYSTYLVWGFVIVFLVGFLVWMFLSSKKRKKQEQEAKDLIDAVKPGNKVKTIGGVCGIVVEVNSEENTFVLETGSESVGKSYVKFDKQAIYQTDAVVEKQAPAATEDSEAPADGGADSEEKPAETAETTENVENKPDDDPLLLKPKKDKKAKNQTEK
ncbi:MAG: preprotein translocase subunit YajC [Clostridiales bacterium]|nr:preprotein translocase subunit YajC [Clostridiales bacterium]